MDKFDVAIIGAGFAGAAAAWCLADGGCKNIIILEREELPGMHASGQNASIMRQLEEDEVIARCAFKGAGFILTPPYHWDQIIDQVGSLILFGKARSATVGRALDIAVKTGLESEIISKKKAALKVPLLADASFDQAVWTTTDGVVDINDFLWSYLKDAKQKGVRLKLKQAVLNIEQSRSKTFIITTEKESYQAGCVVNAAGAWVSEIADMAGALNIKFLPLRRHLYNTTVMDGIDPAWPFVWDIDNEYYFRPESGGLLLGPCDEEEVPPGVPSTSHLVREMLAEKLDRFCPSLSNVAIATEWAGLRTFAPDRRFVIGADPALENFYWAAGLGGHGVTCSHEVGRMVADAILGKGQSIPEEFKPGRFL